MSDRFTIHSVIVFLGIYGILGLVGGFMLAMWGKAVPDFLISTVSAAGGALGALLAKTSSVSPVDGEPVAGPVVTTTTTEVGEV